MTELKQGRDYIGVGVGAVIVNDKNEILLTKRTMDNSRDAGIWAKMGGKVHFGETPEQAIQREAMEELGVVLEILDFLCFGDYHPNGQHWVALHFLARIKKGEPRNLLPKEHSEIKWFSINSLPSPLAENTSGPIEFYKNRII